MDTIQANYADTYFDSTSEINKVYVYYTQEDDRQVKRILHDGTDLSSQVTWSSFSRDGTWEKNKIKVYGHENAVHILNRAAIGTSEDLTHSDGTMTLNV